MAGHAIDVDAVHAQHLNQQLSFQWCPRDVVQVHARIGVVVPNVQSEIFIAHPKRPHGVNVFHHGPPKRCLVPIVKLDLGDGRLQHFEHKRPRGGIPVLAEGAHLVGLAIDGVLIGHRQHLCIVERLTQGNEAEAAVVGEFRSGQTAGVAHALVVDALLEASANGTRNGFVGPGEIHHPLVQGQAPEEIVVVVARGAARHDIGGGLKRRPAKNADIVCQVAKGQIGRNEVGVFPQVGECDHVSHILGVGLCVDHVDLDPVDHHPRIGNGQRPHRLVVLAHKVLGQEVVAVGLIVVGSDVKLLGLGAPLDFNLATLAFLLAEDRGVVKTPPLGFHLQAKKALRPHNQAAVQWHADVSRFNVFQDVVFFSLETNVHLVFKVKQRLGVVLGPQLNLVANFSSDVQLDALVKIDRARPSLSLRNARVFSVVPRVAQ